VEDFPDQSSRYVVSVLPLEQTGMEMVHEVRPGSSEFMNKQLEVEVEVGTQYQITVRADNCGDRQEGNSATITGLSGLCMLFVLELISEGGSCPQFLILHMLVV